VIFVHYCIHQLAYCAAVTVEGFDAVEVCCATVVAWVEPEVCDCVVSGFVFVVFPCGFDVLPLRLIGWGDGFLGEFCCVLCFMSLYCFKVWGCVFVLNVPHTTPQAPIQFMKISGGHMFVMSVKY
jgi:hypothetical protein